MEHPSNPHQSCPQDIPGFFSGVQIMGHPTMPNIQLVIIPSNVQSIIQALTTLRKDHGNPNKYIIISNESSLQTQAWHQGLQMKDEECVPLQSKAACLSKQKRTGNSRKEEQLNVSLSNIQWLGNMSSESLGQCSIKEEHKDKENQIPECSKMEDESQSFPDPQWPLSVTKRPPVNSYLIPLHFPVAQSVLLPAFEPYASEPECSDGQHSRKRVKIAPKAMAEDMESPQHIGSLSVDEEPDITDLHNEVMFHQSYISHPTQNCPSNCTPEALSHFTQEGPSYLTQVSCSHFTQDDSCQFTQDDTSHLTQVNPIQLTQDEDYTLKTPIKKPFSKPPVSSTPSKPIETGLLQPWESKASLPRDHVLDFSPVRIPQGSTCTPFKDNLGTMSFGDTPFKDFGIFGSPQNLLSTLSSVSSPLLRLESPCGSRQQKCCSKEQQERGFC
ncbi:hypothetical protein XELAEV_18016760mg [Xenopus laevis]|uniref:Uncharacterized protein n=1 Tax=Xenopus laevis TaxID=8355 RepID=A0A974HS16_XENLA|nr:hypothetical protein XELAEV_18016760mg [Xenopus laevis]